MSALAEEKRAARLAAAEAEEARVRAKAAEAEKREAEVTHAQTLLVQCSHVG